MVHLQQNTLSGKKFSKERFYFRFQHRNTSSHDSKQVPCKIEKRENPCTQCIPSHYNRSLLGYAHVCSTVFHKGNFYFHQISTLTWFCFCSQFLVQADITVRMSRVMNFLHMNYKGGLLIGEARDTMMKGMPVNWSKPVRTTGRSVSQIL